MGTKEQSLERSSVWRNKLLWSSLALYTLGMTLYLWYETAGLFDWMIL